MSQAITDVLVTEGVISAEQLAEAEELVTVRGEPVLTVLIEQGDRSPAATSSVTPSRPPAWSSWRSWTCRWTRKRSG